jgi:hypothetical protein
MLGIRDMPRPARVVTIIATVFACAGPATTDDSMPSEWRLTGPTVTIGVLDGATDYEFESLSSAWKSDGGRIIVADRGQTSLLFYDEHGQFVRRIGRQGAGPGETRYMGNAFPYRGDSIAVYDLSMRRISVFDSAGVFARAFTSPVAYARKPNVIPSQSCCLIMGAFGDGSFLVQPPDEIPVHAGPPRFGMLSLLRLSAEGEGPDTIGTFESRLHTHDAARPAGVRGYETALPFLYSLGENAVYGGNAQDNILVIARMDGTSMDTVRLGPPPDAFTDDMIATRERLLRDDYERRPQFYEGGIDGYLDGVYPERVPAFSHVLVDREGRIWVGDFSLHEASYQTDPIGKRYRIHSRNGTAIGTVMLPAGSRLTWAGDSEIIAVERDSLDVQYVRVYGLAR